MELLKERILKDGIVKPGNVFEGRQFFKSPDGYSRLSTNWERSLNGSSQMLLSIRFLL